MSHVHLIGSELTLAPDSGWVNLFRMHTFEAQAEGATGIRSCSHNNDWSMTSKSKNTDTLRSPLALTQ